MSELWTEVFADHGDRGDGTCYGDHGADDDFPCLPYRLAEALANTAAALTAEQVKVQRLGEAVTDLCWRAQRYGETEDGDTAFYLLTKGTVHRLTGVAQSCGVPAAFRSDDRSVLTDSEATQ